MPVREIWTGLGAVVFVCLFKCCVCVCGWICLPSGCRRLQAVFNDSPLVSLRYIRDGCSEIRRPDIRRCTPSFTRCVQHVAEHVDGSHTTLFAWATRLRKHTHTLVFTLYGGCRQIHCVCVCVLCLWCARIFMYSFSKNQQPDRAAVWCSVAQLHVCAL